MSNDSNQNKMILLMAGVAAVCAGGYFMFSSKKTDHAEPAKQAAQESAAKDEKADTSASNDALKDSGTVDQKTAEQDLRKPAAVFADKTSVSVSEVLDLINQLPSQDLDRVPQNKLYQIMLLRLINRKLILDEARKVGLDKTETYLSKLPELKDTLLQKIVLEDELKKVMTPAEMEALYKAAIAAMPKEEEVELSHVMVKTKEEAEKILKDLKAAGSKVGEKFKEAVVQHSIDAQTKVKDGAIGWAPKSAQKDLLGDVKANSIVDKVVQLNNQGYSVLFVKGVRPAQPPSLDVLESELRRLTSMFYAMEVIEGLRKEAGLTLTGLDGKDLALPEMPKMTVKQKLTIDTPPKMPESADFSSIDDKKLDDSMVVAAFKNGKKITLKDVRESAEKNPPEMLRGQPFGKVFMPILLRLVDFEILKEKAADRKIAQASEFTKKYDDMSKGALQEMYLEQEVDAKISQSILKDLYKKAIASRKEDMEVNVRHILVKTKEEAEELIKEIKKGGVSKFDELVKEKSIDAQTKDKKGDIGYLPKSRLQPEVASELFKAPKATLVPVPIQMGNAGYSIMRVEDKRVAQPPAFEAVQPQLIKAAAQQERQKFIKKLLTDAKIELHDIKGRELSMKTLIGDKGQSEEMVDAAAGDADAAADDSAN